MRKVICFIFILTVQYSLSQEMSIDSCGLNDEALLNKYESIYFNETFEKQRDGFQFEGKRIAFFEGNFGRNRNTKSEYFERWGRGWYLEESNLADMIVILTEQEKSDSGGYDAILVSWSKPGLPKAARRKVVSKLGKEKK
jgi:hypothetical protein